MADYTSQQSVLADRAICDICHCYMPLKKDGTLSIHGAVTIVQVLVVSPDRRQIDLYLSSPIIDHTSYPSNAYTVDSSTPIFPSWLCTTKRFEESFPGLFKILLFLCTPIIGGK